MTLQTVEGLYVLYNAFDYCTLLSWAKAWARAAMRKGLDGTHPVPGCLHPLRELIWMATTWRVGWEARKGSPARFSCRRARSRQSSGSLLSSCFPHDIYFLFYLYSVLRIDLGRGLVRRYM